MTNLWSPLGPHVRCLPRRGGSFVQIRHARSLRWSPRNLVVETAGLPLKNVGWSLVPVRKICGGSIAIDSSSCIHIPLARLRIPKRLRLRMIGVSVLQRTIAASLHIHLLLCIDSGGTALI